ncbi:MAG: GTPase ObgE [Dehalococcoidia bacterium]|nr:GTPase ObgE [Dehalococcoidia bacterium]
MIDEVVINIKSGNGGNGAISGRREKYVPRGGPDGGDGGRGGSIYLEADPNVNTLLSYRYRRHFSAPDGRRGEGRLKHGKDGKDLTLSVPIGTQVWADEVLPRLLVDLDEPGQKFLAAKGGSGGAGNSHYATPTNRFPLLAQAGEPGEELSLRLELKLLADVGIVGAPNAGKSSLLSVVSAARPKVANYPFTTLEPSLGMIEHRGETFVMVDIPGLIEGAHDGVGLGHEFLRHIERTRVLVHLVDGSLDDPIAQYRQINAELSQYARDLSLKPQVLAVNKLDLTDVSVLRDDLHEAFSEAANTDEIHFISAVTHEGVDALLDSVLRALQDAPDPIATPLSVSPDDLPILRPVPRRRRPAVYVEDDGVYVVEWPPAERMAAMVDPNDWTANVQFYNRLIRSGVVRALEEAGITPGDTVRIGEVEWQWD